MGSSDTPKPKYQGPERRERFRLKQETKVLVKARGKSEVSTILNMTKTGILFSAFGDYQEGQTLDITFPYDPAKPSVDKPMHAEVVRVQEIEGSLKKNVAVKMLGIFLKP